MAKKSGRAAAKPPAKTTKTATSKTVRKGRPSRKTLIASAVARQKAEPAAASGPPPRLPNVLRLTKTAWLTLWRHKRLFIAITLIYGLLNLLLVRGLAGGTDVGSLKQQFDQAFKGHFGGLASAAGVFVTLIGSAGNGSSDTAGAYQLFLALIVSLAVIWALRQVLAGAAIRARDAYYQGMTPLIPFVLVLLVCAVQLLPLLIGSVLYSIIISNGIAVNLIEQLLFLLIFLALAAWSFYLLCASVFALYIVTLPDMTPLKALRSAKRLVHHRRWPLFRKILWLPFVLLVIAAIIMLPIIVWLTPAAQWIFFILTMFALVAVNTYMYTLYRELLHE